MEDFTGSQKESEEKRLEVKREREKELNDIKKVLSFVEGRRLIWRILSKTGIYRLSFAESERLTDFNEGKRSLGLFLLDEVMEAKPTAFSQMQKEYYSQKKEKKDAGRNSDS